MPGRTLQGHTSWSPITGENAPLSSAFLEDDFWAARRHENKLEPGIGPPRIFKHDRHQISSHRPHSRFAKTAGASGGDVDTGMGCGAVANGNLVRSVETIVRGSQRHSQERRNCQVLT